MAPPLLALTLAALSSRAQEPAASPPALSASTAAPAAAVDPERQRVLVEMWRRRVLAPGTDQWTEEEMDLLRRMREAESLGAFDLLRERDLTLRGHAVEHRLGPGPRRLWLTRAGFKRYVFLRSQTARKYFEKRGTDAKFVFELRDMDKKRVFDPQGVLTPAGLALYNRVLRGEKVQWRSGPNVMSNHRPDPGPARK